MKLVIAEKPSVARDLANVLGANKKQNGYLEGNGYQVTWCIGHLVELAEPDTYNEAYRKWNLADLPILPEAFQYRVIASTQPQFQIVQRLIAHSEEIICATDAGREGQLIFQYVLQMSNPPEGCVIRRLWISSMTEEAIRQGFAELKDNREYQRLYQSARCRSEADWLVGINFTRLFTGLYRTKLTVGRVQTPTLALIVERQQAIDNFVPETYYQLYGHFGTLKALWQNGNQNRIDAPEQAEALRKKLEGLNATVTKLDTARKTEDRPLLFDLTELQREANRKFGYTAQETLNIAQSLYETHKLITYPRTDSRYLTADMKPKIPQLLEKMAGVYPEGAPYIKKILSKKLPLDKRIINDSKVSDHHALIVTERIHLYQPNKLTQRENNVLRLIMARMIVALSEKKTYDETKLVITTDPDRDGKQHEFRASGRMILNEGWAEVDRALSGKNQTNGDDHKEESKEEEEQVLTQVSLNQRLHLDSTSLAEKKTTAPKPYTEATLLTAMEKASREIDDESLKESMKGKGLGTPATRAGIIEKLITVGYVERRKKNLFPTKQGTLFIQLVPASIREIEMTAQWELQMQEICDGKGNPDAFLEEIRAYVKKTVAENNQAGAVKAIGTKTGLRRVVGKCPKCGNAVIESDKSFYCDGFRMEHKCNFSIWKNNKYFQARGVTLTAELVEQLLRDGHMQVNGLTSKAGKSYNAIFYMEPGEQYVNFRMEFASGGNANPPARNNAPAASSKAPSRNVAKAPQSAPEMPPDPVWDFPDDYFR